MAGVLAIALVVRVASILTVSPDELIPRWSPGGTDAVGYTELARSLLGGNGFSFAEGLRAWRPPFYPCLLAGCFAVTRPSDYLLPRLVQVGLGLVLVIAIARLAARIWGRDSSLVAALLVGLYPFLVYFTPQLLTETLFAAIVGCTLCIALRASWTGALRDAALSGALCGLGCLTRPTLLSIAPLVAIWLPLAIRARRSATRQRGIASGVLFALATALVIAPWTVRNAIVLHAFVPVSTNGPTNMALGLSSDYLEEVGISTPFDTRVYFTDVSPAPDSRAPEIAGAARRLDQVKALVRDHPRLALELTARKALRLWTPWPGHQRVIQVLSLSCFLPVFVWGVLGLVVLLNGRDRATGTLVLMVFVGFTLVHAFTIPNVRMRVPIIDPLLIALAAGPAGRFLKR